MGGVSGPKIVVGIDGSTGSERALRWAAEEARQRHAQLRVVLAWEPAYMATYSSTTTHADRDEQERTARAVLAEALHEVFGSATPDGVAAAVIEGIAERVLVNESGTADLLVLGATRMPAAQHSGPSVGPVIRGCLSRARCPVTVIRSCEAALRQPTR